MWDVFNWNAPKINENPIIKFQNVYMEWKLYKKKLTTERYQKLAQNFSLELLWRHSSIWVFHIIVGLFIVLKTKVISGDGFDDG